MNNDNGLTITSKVSFHRERKGRLRLTEAEHDAPPPSGRVPRVARLMALALRFQKLLDAGEVRDYAELARLGYVTRARLTQLMNLLHLAPDIQEALLFLPPTEHGRDAVKECQVRPIAAKASWASQRRMWSRLIARRPVD